MAFCGRSIRPWPSSRSFERTDSRVTSWFSSQSIWEASPEKKGMGPFRGRSEGEGLMAPRHSRTHSLGRCPPSSTTPARAAAWRSTRAAGAVRLK